MSYRVDIPTLSANEVYTLTFEYEGTETIQLIVGDLTLETTDRRVVFTTTSPVNYIESNMNLTNLNIYEGYYESDDFGGEYTQESYIEGKSLINLMPASEPKALSQGWSLDFDETTGVATIVFDNNTNNFSCSMRSFNMMKKLKPATYYTYFVEILENSLVNGSGNKPNIMFYNASGYMYPSTQCPYNVETAKGDCINKSGTERWTIKNEASPGKYVWAIKTVDTFVDTMVDADKIFQTAALNGTIKVRMMIIEGDYVDNPIETNWFPQGIGCVKSPTIKSLSPENLYVSPLKYREPLRGYEYYHNDGTVEIYPNGSGAYSTIDLYTGEDVGLSYLGSPKTWYVNNGIKLGLGAGTYYFCCEIELVANKQITDFTGKPQISVIYDNAQYFVVSGNFTETYDGEKYYYKGIFGAANTTVTDDIRGIYVGIWSYGISGVEKYIIRNITLTREASLKDVCAISKSSIITTPDDLELHAINDSCKDVLDLTTGVVTKNIGIAKNCSELISNHSYDSTNMIYTCRLRWGGLPNILTKGNNTLGMSNVFQNVLNGGANTMYSHGIDGAYYLKFGGCTTFEECKQYCIDNNVIIYYQLATPYTEQLSLNHLKSYRNGSIQTSSQQLAPTLKTTLPISNKFTTTNLTSGSTYNVYFDGTATKLDAGGTIITDPVSPCEVECGGTTLTIEGTDIQNVRVLETTNKNEVGSINGTTDVELNRIITSDLEVITNDIEFSSVGTDNGNINTVDNKLGTINTKGGHTWGAGYFTSNKTYPKGFSLLHIEFDVDMPSDNLMAIINFNNNVSHDYYNFRDLTLDNDTATIAQGQTSGVGVKYSSIVTKGHFSRLMYCFSSQGKINLNINTGSSAMSTASGNSAEGSTSGYTACANNGVTISNFKIKVIENYPDATSINQITSSLRTDSGLTVIWQDMNMSIGQSISKLEQPIKLRSLGTTYDSYNPVTGELTKRIGVSETDGSYSVLSSPVVMETRKTEVNGYMADRNTICKEYSKGYEFNTSGQLFFSNIGHYTDYYIEIPENTKTLSFKGMSYYKRIMIYDENKKFIKCFYTYDNYGDATGNITSDMKYVRLTTVNEGSQGRGYGDMRSYLVTDTNYLVFTSDTSLQTLTVPHLYTNGQVKVYSDSEVYPTTILNGQSTNNYEVNELNKSNNYTIRYEGECESINLANKSNEQGTNRIVKSGTNGSGNLTFVNDNGDIDNVLLVEHDVREQEINHFNGLQTVEVSGMLIETSQNMWWNDWIAPSEYGASWQVDSPEFISVQPGETIYVVANNNNYTGLIEFDENYNIVNQGKELILSDEANPKPVNLGNNYYKNYRVLSENTRYVKFTIPASTAVGAKNETRWSVISFTKTDVGNVPLYTNNTPYRGSTINLPQPVQLNRIHKENMPYGAWSNVLGQHVNLANGIAYDSYNPITGEYIQRVYKMTLNGDDGIKYIDNWSGVQYAINDSTLPYPRKARHADTTGRYAGLIDVYGVPYGASYNAQNDIFVTWLNLNAIVLNLPRKYTNNVFNQNACKQWLRENPITLFYELETPIVTQLTPIDIPTFEGGIVQLITTDGKVFPMVEYSMPTNNRYDTSSWETGAVYTQRNMTEAYFNESTTPMIPTETMTLTTDHISSGSIILNDNGNGLIVLKGNYTGRDIPYFTGVRSVEAIEVETTPSPDQPLFGKGGRK